MVQQRQAGRSVRISRRAGLLGLAALAGAGGPAAWLRRATAAEPVRIDHALGSVTLPSPASRVVALEYTVVEDLLALNAVPVGAADIKGYGTYVGLGKDRLSGVTDVGTRQEPNLELIAGLRPDLIVAPAFRHANLYGAFSAIAPTAMFEVRPTGPETALADAIQSMKTLSRATGREEEAKRVEDSLVAAIGDAAQRLSAKGLSGARVLLVQFLPGSPHLRIFGAGSLPGGVASRMALRNAWEGPTDAFGFATAGVDALAKLSGAHLLYVAKPDDETFLRLRNGPVWASLDFVAQGRVHALPPSTWFFGGPSSAIALAQRIAAAMTEA